MRTLIQNAKIYVNKDCFAESMLIEDGIIKEIGTNADLSMSAYDELYEAEGRTIIPGLNDSHLHMQMVGAAMRSCNLSSARSTSDIIDIGRNYLESNPGITFIHGRGWNQDLFTNGEKRMPNIKDLDSISKEIPIVFDRVCIHMTVLNSKALELLGVDNKTKIEGGELLTFEDGTLNGIFTENAVAFGHKIIPKKTKEDVTLEFKLAQDYAVSMGLTSVQSCDILGVGSKDMFEVLKELNFNDELKLRYSHQFNYQNIESFKNYLATEFKTEGYDFKNLSRGVLKLFKDGSLGARTALLKEDYHDCPGQRGVAALTDQEILEAMTLAAEYDIPTITHAIGDAAVESVINCIDEVNIKTGKKLRHGIVHNQITSLSQLQRIAKLGIEVYHQPIFLDYDNKIIIDRVGLELAKTSYAYKTLYELGGHISFGTDSPVEDLNPFKNIYVAVNRKGLDETPKDGYFPDECMSVENSIDCYTIGSAHAEGKEDFKGRLEPGFVADYVVLDRDIFTIDPMHIKDVRPVKTVVDGETVWKKEV